MNKITKKIFPSLFLAMMFLFANKASAQVINDQATIVSDYDPISANLDSLVNLTYIKRLNQVNAGSAAENFKPFEVPNYSPEVYKKRIEKIQTPIPLCYNSQVQEYITMYGFKKRGLTERVMGLSGLYFPMFEQILDQQGLPVEFKYLAIVESALNPTAVSRMGATGLWQFMFQTGKLYNLKVNSFIDERRDPEKSTYAACQYFKDMYAIYNDWLLVIAAYNCGAGNVNKAIARSGGKKTFWEICQYLPRETRGYVPAFIAVTYLMTYSSDHNLIPVAPLISFYDADTVFVDQKVSLHTIADVTGTPLSLVSYLNPVYKKGIIPDSDEQQVLRLPVNKINTYLANVSTIFKPVENPSLATITADENSIGSLSSELVKKYHLVKKGEHLQGIAKKYHCTVSDLKNWNKIKGTQLKAGQKLAVYVMSRKNQGQVAEKGGAVKENKTAKNETKPVKSIQKENNGESKMVYHTVQPGDSLWKIAQRYEGVTVEQIKELNNLQSNNLKVGTKLKIAVTG